MIHKASGRTAFILVIGLGIGFGLGSAGPSWAADPQTDAAPVTAPTNPADVQPAPASQAAPADQTAPTNQAAGADQQFNDADRSVRPNEVQAPVTVAQSQAETPAVRANPVVAGSENATWDETSLIGKIFIGFGALLTIASAARMFMA